MKPLKLSMSAFGPYAEKETLDFTVLGASTLFLICGPTGAGKSTVLDAMCYALYGKTSGGVRSGGNLRSDYAGPDVMTEVTFDFSLGDKIYRVYRCPEQMRQKKRAKDTSAVALQKAEAALYELDAEGNEKKLLASKNVEKEIDGLLGVEVDQFRQIILLPQGDFRKLLLADSQDRQKIMQKLFRTDVYWRLEMKLAGRVKALEKEYDALRLRISERLSSCGAAGVEALAEKRGEAEKKSAEAAALYEKAEAGAADFLKEYDAAKTLAEAWTRLSRADADEKKLAAEKEKMDALALRIEKISMAARLEPEVRQLEKTYASGVERARQLADAERNYEALAKRLGAEAERKAALDREAPARKAEGVELARLRQMQPAAARYGEAAAEADAFGKKAAEAERARVSAENQHGVRSRDAEEKKRVAGVLAAAFLHGQAAYLAESLEEGQPCPVCGATHHPAKAHTAEAVPRKEDVENARAAAETAEKAEVAALQKFQKAQRAEADAKTACAAAAERLAQLADRVPEEYRNPEALGEAIRRLEKSAADYEKRLGEAQAAAQELAGKTKAAETEKTLLEKDVEALRDQYRKDQAVLEERSREEGFDGQRELKEYFREIPEEPALRQTVSAYKAAVKSAADRKADETKTIAGRPRPDMAEWDEKRRAADRAVKDALTAKNSWEHAAAQYKDAMDAIEAIKKEQEKTGAAYTLAGRLYDLYRGKENGINLERFVLGALLDDVTEAANLRLHTMSGGRYRLARRTGERLDRRKGGGLDLEVFDSYTGKNRPAATLSGGETFLASLSLALGLADVVQEYAGGIRLDAMFIDEGFGTLDSESLDLALKTLMKLQSAGRLVGIISHVDELEERIPAKLRVTKTERGSRAAFEIG